MIFFVAKLPSKNIEDLIVYIQELVKEKRGIDLETEVKFIGEK